jgi:hypothetical protein
MLLGKPGGGGSALRRPALPPKPLTQALKRIPGITKVDTKQARGLKGIRLKANVEI